MSTAALDFYRRRARETGSVQASDWPQMLDMRDSRPARPEPLTGDRKVRRATLPQFVKRGDTTMRRADDDETMRRAEDDQELDDQQDLIRCRKCGRFVATDDSDQSLDDDEQTMCARCAALEEDQEASDEDLDDDQVQLEGYDSGDVWDEDQSDNFAPSSRQPERSTGRTTVPARDSRRHSGPDSSRPGMNPGRDPIDVDHRWQQMGSERYMTVNERMLARRLDALERGQRRMVEEPIRPSVLGEDLVERARRYARQYALNWRDPSQRMSAFAAVSGSDPNNLAAGVENEYAILATQSRDVELVEPLTDGEWVDAAKRLALRRGWDYSDPDVRLQCFQLAGAR